MSHSSVLPHPDPREQKILKEIPMSRKNVVLILMSWASFVIPASAQHFEQVTGTLVSVAAGRNEVFGLSSGGAIWRYDASTQAFNRIAGSLQQVAVGGGSLSQLDEVWGITGGAVYHFNYTTGVFDHVAAPALSQIAVGEGVEDNCHPYEVWGVVPGSSLYRYNYCSNSFELNNSGPWTQVATGGGGAWGIESTGTLLDVFDSGIGAFGGNLTQVAVGVNDVWAINSSNKVFRFDPNIANPLVPIGGILQTFKQIAAGGDGVWAVSLSNEIFQFQEDPESFVQVPGTLTSIAVGSGAGVWGVNSSGQVFTFVRP
jgi:virginiamycin B lyase